MSLLEEAAALAPTIGPKCSVAVLLDSLTETEQAQVVELLDSTYSAQTVVNVLQAHKWTGVRKYTVERHRNRECRCPH